ncbi:MAG: adenine phosphoribosyltransferase [Candidatus Aminicenantes bacterium]|nr:adenine phosphoribosyltransferase [Candidatus Aminicenantes bacterium]
MEFEKYIRDIPDFPEKGIVFKDITTLLIDSEAFSKVIDKMADPYKGKGIDKVVGIESRGFIFGGMLSYILGAGFVPARKAGKLPYKTIRESYSLEYGESIIELHEDSINKGDKILLVDDLLATGGTAEAVVKLIKRLGGEISGIEFLIELDFLNGKEKLIGENINSVIHY